MEKRSARRRRLAWWTLFPVPQGNSMENRGKQNPEIGFKFPPSSLQRCCYCRNPSSSSTTSPCGAAAIRPRIGRIRRSAKALSVDIYEGSDGRNHVVSKDETGERHYSFLLG